MNTSCSMFLLTVEEMSITQAAKKAFVTQQCLSAHIKKLEDEYEIKLFERKPKLTLTPAGQSLYHALRKIQIAEQAIKEKMIDIKDGTKGEIFLGINSGRARILLPRVYPEYHKMFPKVKISIVLDDVKNLATRLLDGKLDVFLGVDSQANKNFNFQPITTDEVYLIATEALLKQYATTSEIFQRTTKSKIIDLLEFPRLPSTGNLSGSTLSNLVVRYHNYNNIPQNTSFAVSDASTQVALCGLGQVCAFVPRSILQLVIDYNKAHAAMPPLEVYRLKNNEEKLHIDFITNKYAYQPYYLQAFMQHFVTVYHEYLDELNFFFQ